MLRFLSFSFNQFLKVTNLKIFNYLKQLEFPLELWISKWFLSFFTLVLPKEFLLRVFDFLIFNDVFGLIYIGLIIVN